MRFHIITSIFLVLATQALAQPLTATDGEPGDAFGTAVATDGSIIVVGAPGVDVDGKEDQGAAYIFARRRGTWQLQAMLTSADGGAGDEFGHAVAISRGTIVVGAPFSSAGDEPLAGAVHVFRRQSGVWRQVGKYWASDARAGAQFGFSVATDGNRIVVGSPWAHVDFDPMGNFLQGAAYVYSRQESGWLEEAKLSAGLPIRWSQFGWSVGISNRHIAIGSPARLDYSGAVHVFEKTGQNWQPSGELNPGWGVNGSNTGYAVATHGNLLAIGVPYDSLTSPRIVGAVHFYRNRHSWQQDTALAASTDRRNDWFGAAIALSGARMVAAAPQVNEAYLFSRDAAGSWEKTASFLPEHEGPWFGGSVALAGNLVAIGHGSAEVNGDVNRGAVIVEMID